MTWLDVAGKNPWLTLAAVLGLAALIACGFAMNRILRQREEAAEFDADLDETSILELTHDVPMRDLRETPTVAGLDLYEAAQDPMEDGLGASDMLAGPSAMDRGPAALPRLTPAQRRRAVHKGRIPRDHPAPPGRMPAPRGGESNERLISGILAAELDAGRWLAAEADRAREEETLRERAELDARIDEAYRVVGAGFADLEARNWLELAA